MLMSTSHKFIFFHIPKNAGTSIRTALNSYCNISSQYPEFINQLTEIKKTHSLVHVKQKNVRNLVKKLKIDLSEYLEFVIVREPLNRLISLYNYHGVEQGFKNFYQYAIDTAIGRKNNNVSLTRHSQLDWITDPLTNNLTIYKLEELDKELVLNNLTVSLTEKQNVNLAKKISLENIRDHEIKFCLDFLSEEYEILGYKKP
jgi:hypothetical protein